MKKLDITLPDVLYTRIREVANRLNIPEDDLLTLWLIDGGYYRYWTQFEKLCLDTPEILDKEDATNIIHENVSSMADQYRERLELLDDIEALEKDFQRTPRQFASEVEEHRAFLDFIEDLHTLQIIQAHEKELEEEEQPLPQEEPEVVEPPKEMAVQKKAEFPFKLFPKAYVPMLVFIAFSDFLVIKLIQVWWPSFTIGIILQYNVLQLLPYFLLILFTSLIVGATYRHYYKKYQANVSIRQDLEQYREYMREFNRLYPRTYSKDPVIQIQNENKRTQDLARFIESRQRPDKGFNGNGGGP